LEFGKGFMCDALMVVEVKERVALTDKRESGVKVGKRKREV
jgi:hypothetical protein